MRWALIPLAGAAFGVAVPVVTDATRGGTGLPDPPVATSACGGFDFPVGPPDASGYYDAQPFGINDHLGNDWNGNGGGDTDLGDPVHALATGVVTVASDHGGGWGNVVRVVHPCGEVPGQEVESLYAHLDTVEVQAGQRVGRGQRLGTIGTAGGQYRAHLHLELRARPGLPLGGGYSEDTAGYLDPSAFIRRHR
jgi:murein DD-endopeptidase MepM/ murein hydrolase activator NlpD